MSGNDPLGQWLDTLPFTEDEWLQDSPAALASVLEGLEQAEQGGGKYLGSFAEWADMEVLE